MTEIISITKKNVMRYRMIVVFSNGPMLVKDFHSETEAYDVANGIDEAKNFRKGTHTIFDDENEVSICIDADHVVSVKVMRIGSGDDIIDEFTYVDNLDSCQGFYFAVRKATRKCKPHDSEPEQDLSSYYHDRVDGNDSYSNAKGLYEVYRVTVRMPNTCYVKDFHSKSEALKCIRHLEIIKVKGRDVLVLDGGVFSCIYVDHIISIDCDVHNRVDRFEDWVLLEEM